GPLVLVVREDQVQPAAVDVELRAEVGGGHRRALQVPAGAPSAPWRRPGRLAGFGALPHGEVPGIAFARRGGFTLAHLVETLTRQRTVVGEGGDREVHITLRGVGVPAVD